MVQNIYISMCGHVWSCIPLHDLGSFTLVIWSSTHVLESGSLHDHMNDLMNVRFDLSVSSKTLERESKATLSIVKQSKDGLIYNEPWLQLDLES